MFFRVQDNFFLSSMLSDKAQYTTQNALRMIFCIQCWFLFSPTKIFNPDPRQRHTLWNSCVNGFLYTISLYGTDQAQIQRMMSMKDKKSAMV